MPKHRAARVAHYESFFAVSRTFLFPPIDRVPRRMATCVAILLPTSVRPAAAGGRLVASQTPTEVA